MRSDLVTTDGSPFDPVSYEVSLRPLDPSEGGGWLATIPSLPGCSGDGESELSALRDVRLAALEWAEAAAADRDPIPAPLHRSPLAAE